MARNSGLRVTKQDFLACFEHAANAKEDMAEFISAVSTQLFKSGNAANEFSSLMSECLKEIPDQTLMIKHPELTLLAKNLLLLASQPESEQYARLSPKSITLDGHSKVTSYLQSDFEEYLKKPNPTLDGLVKHLKLAPQAGEVFKKQLKKPFDECVKSKNKKILRDKLILGGMIVLFAVAQVATIAASVFGLGGLAGTAIGALAAAAGIGASFKAIASKAKELYKGEYAPSAKHLAPLTKAASTTSSRIEEISKILKAEGVKSVSGVANTTPNTRKPGTATVEVEENDRNVAPPKPRSTSSSTKKTGIATVEAKKSDRSIATPELRSSSATRISKPTRLTRSSARPTPSITKTRGSWR